MRWLAAVGAPCLVLCGPACGQSPGAAGGIAERAPTPNEHRLLFSGFDLWHGGGFGHAGLLWSPSGLDRNGFALKTLIGTGTYRYRAGDTLVTGRQFVASVLPGWRFVRNKFELSVFAGLDLQHHRLSLDDSGNRLRGGHAGSRAGAELWWEPTDASMASLVIFGSTVGASYWTRGAVGWRVLDALYLGPEVSALGDSSYHQLRLGAHATALKTGAWEWSAGVGWTSDNDKRSGLYVRAGVLTRR